MWFGLRVLKAIQLMEVPLLKLWIHRVAMDGIINALVDPGKLDICGRPSIVLPSTVKKTSRTPRCIFLCLTVLVASCSKIIDRRRLG